MTHTHNNDGNYTVIVLGVELPKRFRYIRDAREAGRHAYEAQATPGITDEVVRQVMQTISQRPFHTAHFIEELKIQFPQLWHGLVTKYGQGGSGAGSYFTANNAVSQVLSRAATRNVLDKLKEYGSAPRSLNWGSPVIRYWTNKGEFALQEFPDEMQQIDNASFPEGALKTVKVNRYERSPAARAACISYHGATCKCCSMNFSKRYGERGENFIHVHHLIPLHRIKTGYEVDPVKDLVPVCPNCHAIIHRKSPMLTIKELRALLQRNVGI